MSDNDRKKKLDFLSKMGELVIDFKTKNDISEQMGKLENRLYVLIEMINKGDKTEFLMYEVNQMIAKFHDFSEDLVQLADDVEDIPEFMEI